MIRTLLRNTALTPLPDPNIFIGGVGGAYISEVANYVTLTSLSSVDQVENFQIDANNNVSLFCEVVHTLDRSFLNNNSTCTYAIFPSNVRYVDTSFAGFQNVYNLKYLYLIGQTQSMNTAFINISNLAHLFFENVVTAGSFRFSNVKLKVAKFNKLEIHSGILLLAGATLIERIYIPKLDNITNSNFNYDSCFNLIKTNCKIYHNAELGVKNRRSWGFILSSTGGYQVGNTLIINGLTYTCVAGTPSADGEFDGAGSWITSRAALILAINNDTRSGTFGKVLAYTGGNFITNLACDTVGVGGDSCNIDITGSNATSTSGAFLKGGFDVHQCLMYARDERSAVLIQVSTPISVNPPTSLSAANQTANSVDLNFTPPTPNANATDGYEVWVDDGTVYRYLFEYAEISASGDTLDLAKVVTDVGSISGVKIKIRTIDGHMNFSEFSNEITLP